MSDSREALAHQRLAARLLALRTQQLENKLSRVSDNFVAPDDICLPQEGCHVEDKLLPASDYCLASSESDNVEEILSQVSDDFATPCDIGSPHESCHVEDNCVTYDEFCKMVEEKLVLVSNNSAVSSLQESNEVKPLCPMEKYNGLLSSVNE